MSDTLQVLTCCCPECGLSFEDDELRERVKELEERCGTLNTDRLDAMRLVDEWKSKFYDELARVRELEKDLKWAWSSQKCKSHHFTDEQIDAAVEYVNKAAPHIGWFILNKLHIFRCEGCRRIGRVYEFPCPDRKGHGWVIGGEGE
jgi:hypothetical protein